MPQVFGEWLDAVIANSGTSTDELNLGRAFEFLQIVIPTVTSGTLKLEVAEDTGGTFQSWGDNITTNTTTGAYSATWNLGSYQFIKIVSSVSQGAERTFRIRGFSTRP